MGLMRQDDLAARFQRDMKHAVDVMIRQLNYHPTVFIRMLSDYGAVGAAKRLLATPRYQYGFEKLFEHNRLDYSVEAFVVLPWYQALFTPSEVQTAEDRLALMGFDVAGHRARSTAPDWA